jgi:DNA-binding response OmpR family regulator
MSKKLVLIADDEPHVLRVLKMSVERAGFAVQTASHGQAAWDFLSANHIDALITDIDMPKMTGEMLCAKIEQEITDRTFPIFVATSRTEIEHREWSSNIKNLEFLEKPLSAKKLVILLNNRIMGE